MIDPGLIERVRSGEGADRELDARIFDALSSGDIGSAHQAVIDRRTRPNWLPAYTSSLDAVVAAVEEKVPHLRWLAHAPRWGASAGGSLTDQGKRRVYSSDGKSPARALLTALLLALSAKDAAHADR